MTIDRENLEALARMDVDSLPLPDTCKAEAATTKALACELLAARREIDRLTPPPHERYVRCSTNIVEELRTPSAPVRLTVTEEPDGFYYFVATRYDCPEAA